MKLKKWIGYKLSVGFFWMGHFVSWVEEPICNFLYSLYNKLMTTSSRIQEWAGNDGPWVKVESKDV